MSTKYDEAEQRLADGVKELIASDKWREFLEFSSRFHKYSMNNIMLILGQKPNATMVAGYRAWGEMNRGPKTGSAIWIYGFSTKKYKEKNAQTGEEEEKKRATFPLVKVFDISDTFVIDEEKPDPATESVSFATQLEGADNFGIYELGKQWLEENGWALEEGSLGGPNGRALLDGTKKILLEQNMSDAQKAKTLLHEIAHARMHANEEGRRAESLNHRGIAEVEAESVSFVVANALGLDASDYSVGYVASWSAGDPELVLEVGKRVMSVKKELIDWFQERINKNEEG